MCLSQHRRSCDTHHPRIAMHDCRVRDPFRTRRETVPIDEQEVRPQTESSHGAMHGQDRCPQDVHLVDLLRCRHPDSPRHGLTFDDHSQTFTGALRELLAVIQLLVLKVRRQHNGSRKHRPGQTSTACFIAARFHPAGFQKRLEHRCPLLYSTITAVPEAVTMSMLLPIVS